MVAVDQKAVPVASPSPAAALTGPELPRSTSVKCSNTTVNAAKTADMRFTRQAMSPTGSQPNACESTT